MFNTYYLLNQSLSDMARHPQLFLKMMKAEEEGLIEVKVSMENDDGFKRQLRQDCPMPLYNVSDPVEPSGFCPAFCLVFAISL